MNCSRFSVKLGLCKELCEELLKLGHTYFSGCLLFITRSQTVGVSAISRTSVLTSCFINAGCMGKRKRSEQRTNAGLPREGAPRTACCKSCITLKNELKCGHKFPSCQSEEGILFIFSIYIVLQRKPRSVLDSDFETHTHA